MKQGTRLETDSIGDIEIPKDRMWGAQTQRSILNFQISTRKLPWIFLRAVLDVKRACAITNKELDQLDPKIADVIVDVTDELITSGDISHFPLDVYQTGSGTQTNMNVNEVIANMAISKLGGIIGSKSPIHPNDHVNKGQSSNDVIPTALHVSVVFAIEQHLIPALDKLQSLLRGKRDEFMDIIKIGRTHLQDAVPMTLGQEFSGYISQLEIANKSIRANLDLIRDLAIGGTAVGTGLNAHENLGERVALILSDRLGTEFRGVNNKFALLAGKDGILMVSAALRSLGVVLMKIANDIRMLASGPRAGLGELILPANEPGSSIMPGKVNPTQCEMIMQVGAQVIGNDATISVGAQGGYFELNLMKPLIVSNIHESINILSNAMNSFGKHAITGLTANKKRIEEMVSSSLMLVTALTKHPRISYDLASKIAKQAHEEGKNIDAILREKKILQENEINTILDLKQIVNTERTYLE